MAEKSQKTEQPTPKHKKEMRQKGSVARSAEIGGWAGVLIVGSEIPRLGANGIADLHALILQAARTMGHPSASADMEILQRGLGLALTVSLPIVGILGLIGTAVAVAQVGLKLTPEGMKPKWSRLSPKGGFKKMFAAQGMWTLGKTCIKLLILAGIGYLLLHQLMSGIFGSGVLPLGTVLARASSSFFAMIRYIGILALAIAGADYYFEKRKHSQDLKMTKEEVKREFRETEGSPEMKRSQKSKARQLSRRQIMAAVAQADVVVTNPTHFAVALSYTKGTDVAPRVLTKGEDFNAFEIKQRAKVCRIPIVENPPLARSLYASCEVNEIIPSQLYSAVAHLLAFVYSLSPAARLYKEVHKMPEVKSA